MIVITGAGGFIGSHLVTRLIHEGKDVRALDLSRAIPPNLMEFEGNPRFEYRPCDIRDLHALRGQIPASVEAVFHMAATVGVRSYIERPIETIDTIVGGTKNVLEACLGTKARLIYFSTSEVYGKNPRIPWRESSDRVLGPPSVSRWTYSSSKGVCEHLVNAVHDANGLPTTIVRPFNVYGPRQRPDFVVPSTIYHVLRGERPQIYDTGSQTRCFTFIDDVVDGLWATLDPRADGETFNLGSQEEHTVSEAVHLAIRACDSSIEPEYVQTSKLLGEGYEDVPRRVPDSSRAREVLGWVARTKLESGLRTTVEWARSHPSWLEPPVGASR